MEKEIKATKPFFFQILKLCKTWEQIFGIKNNIENTQINQKWDDLHYPNNRLPKACLISQQETIFRGNLNIVGIFYLIFKHGALWKTVGKA